MGKARAFFLILFLFALSGFHILWSQQGGEGAVTVYVTNSGTKYHLETCSSLSRSKIAITLTDALGSGYEACLVCNPPPGAYPGTGAPPPRQRSGLYRVNTGKLPAFAAADRSRMVQAEVVDHVDGDTVRVRVPNPPSGLNVVETIRMLGVDTPETVHPGRPV